MSLHELGLHDYQDGLVMVKVQSVRDGKTTLKELCKQLQIIVDAENNFDPKNRLHVFYKSVGTDYEKRATQRAIQFLSEGKYRHFLTKNIMDKLQSGEVSVQDIRREYQSMLRQRKTFPGTYVVDGLGADDYAAMVEALELVSNVK